MNNSIPLSELIQSISVTHKMNKDELIFLNTSDVLAGNILTSKYTRTVDLKGQAKKTIQNGDILYSEIRPKNKRYAYVKNIPNTEDYVVSTKLMVLRNMSDHLNTDYLYHFLTYEGTLQYLQNRAENRIGSFPQITFDIVKTLNIRLPDLDEQRSISRTLSTLDDKIELNRKINAELEQMARTLYDYWFVQFDFPDANGKPYKSSGGAMKFSPELNREIPEGWQVQNMLENDLFEVIKPRIDHFNGEKQYIATADVNGLNISDGSPITYENRESRANMQPKAFTVWFAKMKNSIKHVLVGDYSDDLIEKTIFSTGFMGLQTKREAFEYVALTVHRPYFELVKDSNSSGATMEAIGNSAMANMKLIIPDDRTLKMFYEVARPLLEKIDQNRQESQNLAHLRDWLLPMLMNGQVKVKS